jgi:curved DNA-binding protein
MKFKDYYRIMEVAPQATAEEIKTAYRKLARKYHPDVNKDAGAQKSFTDLGEANEVLKDPKRRAAYDELRAGGWKDGQEVDGPPQAHDFRDSGESDPSGAAHFSDFFRSFFGGSSTGGRRDAGFGRTAFQERGEDIHYRLVVSVEESFHGGERDIRLQLPALDESGQMVGKERSLTVKIPKGVLPGTHLRLRGQGQQGASAALHGDLYLEIELAPHHLYRVDGRNLTIDVPIAPWEAVLGGHVEVPTLGGMVTATIPPDTQQGQKLRLKGRGLPGDPPGDQYLHLIIVVPATSSDKARDLYRALAKESSFSPRATLGA